MLYGPSMCAVLGVFRERCSMGPGRVLYWVCLGSYRMLYGPSMCAVLGVFREL